MCLCRDVIWFRLLTHRHVSVSVQENVNSRGVTKVMNAANLKGNLAGALRGVRVGNGSPWDMLREYVETRNREHRIGVAPYLLNRCGPPEARRMVNMEAEELRADSPSIHVGSLRECWLFCPMLLASAAFVSETDAFHCLFCSFHGPSHGRLLPAVRQQRDCSG